MIRRVGPSRKESQDCMVSPSQFLLDKAGSPQLVSFDINHNAEQVTCDGIMYRKNQDGKFKKYFHSLLGSELYVYKSKEDASHKQMNSLIGVFIKDEQVEKLDSKTQLHPFKLIYPGHKERIYYLETKEDKVRWMDKIKEAVGYCEIQKYYNIQNTLGHGKFGLVKLATHIRTGKHVAVKVIDKKQMDETDHFLQHREIEILKMC